MDIRIKSLNLYRVTFSGNTKPITVAAKRFSDCEFKAMIYCSNISANSDDKIIRIDMFDTIVI